MIKECGLKNGMKGKNKEKCVNGAIVPDKFGLKSSCPTESSDCYALGMVIYETISGNLPFHEDTDIMVFAKVLKGKHPPQGTKFKKSLWRMLERCWESQPSNRPSIRDVLVETDGGPKARREFHVSDTVRDNAYVITARHALIIAAPDDPEPLAPICSVPLMYDVALCHSMIPSCHAIQL